MTIFSKKGSNLHKDISSWKKTVLARMQPPAYKWKHIVLVEGDAAYLQWRRHFYKSHFFKALFAWM